MRFRLLWGRLRLFSEVLGVGQTHVPFLHQLTICGSEIDTLVRFDHFGLKDAKLIAEAGALANVPMPSHNVYLDRLVGATAHGDGERDQAVLGREQARAAGLE